MASVFLPVELNAVADDADELLLLLIDVEDNDEATESTVAAGVGVDDAVDGALVVFADLLLLLVFFDDMV